MQVTAWADDKSADSQKLAIEINLEMRTDGRWRAVDNQAVFRGKDEIRFHFHSSASGYLYVLDRTTSGETIWLFPLGGQGQSSRVEADTDYLVPGIKGSFEVDGPPGFDVTYWVLSPVPIYHATAPAFGRQPNTLVPRCRPEWLQARGICTDDRAGPHAVNLTEDAPVPLPRSERLVARELKFQTEGGATHISAPNVNRGVLVYEFHIAHR
jgi:hypothetical protein